MADKIHAKMSEAELSKLYTEGLRLCTPRWSKKDYEMVAEVIHSQYDETAVTYCVLQEITHKFANRFQEDNPRFNRAKFLRACGVAE